MFTMMIRNKKAISRPVCLRVCVCVCSTQFAGKFALRNKSANVSPRSD